MSMIRSMSAAKVPMPSNRTLSRMYLDPSAKMSGGSLATLQQLTRRGHQRLARPHQDHVSRGAAALETANKHPRTARNSGDDQRGASGAPETAEKK